VFRLVAQLVLLVVWVITLPFALLRRYWPIRRGTYVTLEIDGAIADFARPRRFFEVGPPRTTSLFALGKIVDAVLADDRIAGLVLTVKQMRGGMAKATALRAALVRLREAKRDVVVHLPLGGSTKTIYVASAAQRLFLGPQSRVDALGFLSSTAYLKRTLDRAGVAPEVYAQGEYKSAGEQLARDSMSDANREQVTALLDGMHGALVDAIAKGRGVERDAAIAMIDGSPYQGARAVDAKIADGTAYEDELAERLGRPRLVPAASHLASRRALRMRSVLRLPAIGVIPIHGVIAGASPFPLGKMATDERAIAAIRAARASRRILGVVLHVDSPGGSALASDRIHHELVQLAAEKPLVACFSDVAASGGYYVAAAAHAIVAQPTTITGSIGVVATRLVIDPLLARLGVVTEIVQRGAHAHLNGGRAFGEDERRIIDRELADFYQSFVAIVAAGRKRAPEEIDAVARGRVWTGADAHARGLVDRLGGFDAALDEVRARIGRGAARLEPTIVQGPRNGIPPLDPPRRALVEAAADLIADVGFDARALAFAATREPFLAICLDALSIRS